MVPEDLARVAGDGPLDLVVPAHDLRVLLYDGPTTDAALARELGRLMAAPGAGSGG
jgi:hypothetical protein